MQKLSNFVIFQTEEGKVNIDVFFAHETLWLTQKVMAELFDTTKQNISLHLKNIFDEGELEEKSVVKEFLTTAADGKSYKTLFYSLDVIISVGYRVNSNRATKFKNRDEYAGLGGFSQQIFRIIRLSDSNPQRHDFS